MLKNLIAVALIASAPVLQAQVRVVESSPQGFGSGVAQPSMPASAESDVYSQIRSLQEEISTLRGLVEEQAYELKQLKQLQLDNYMDLDRRLLEAVVATVGNALDYRLDRCHIGLLETAGEFRPLAAAAQVARLINNHFVTNTRFTGKVNGELFG
mgnify:CR=1 FL=1